MLPAVQNTPVKKKTSVSVEKLNKKWKLSAERRLCGKAEASSTRPGRGARAAPSTAHAEPRRPRPAVDAERDLMGGESDGAAGGGAQGPPSPLSARPPRGRLTLALARCPPPVKRGHRGVPCRTEAVSAGGGPPGGPSPAAWTLVWDVVHSPACGCPSRLPVAAARPAAPRGVPTGDPGGGRRVCADLAAPTRCGWIWGAGGSGDRHFQPARCWGRGRAGARRRPEEREGGLGTVRSVALPAPPGSPPRPGGVGGGVGCQSQSRAPEGPGRPGDVPAHALQAPPQAQVPRGQQGEPTAQLLPLLSCHTDVIFL